MICLDIGSFETWHLVLELPPLKFSVILFYWSPDCFFKNATFFFVLQGTIRKAMSPYKGKLLFYSARSPLKKCPFLLIVIFCSFSCQMFFMSEQHMFWTVICFAKVFGSFFKNLLLVKRFLTYLFCSLC